MERSVHGGPAGAWDGADREGVSDQYAMVTDIRMAGRAKIQVGQLFTLQGDSLTWLIRIRNMTDSLLEIGDLAVPLPYNNRYGEDGSEIFEERVIKQHFVGGDGSFLYWMRPSGIGPYLLLTPNVGTRLEFFDLQERARDLPSKFSVYVHSVVKGRENPRGNWRQSHTTVTLQGQRSPRSSVTYGFTFRSREVNKGGMFIGLKPKRERKKSQEALMAEVRKKFTQIPGLQGTAEMVSLIGGGLRRVPVQFSITGRDLKELETYTQEIVRKFSQLPGIVVVDTTLEVGKPEVRVFIDRDKAADLGVDVATVAEAVNFLIGGEVDVTKFKDTTKGRRYDVRAGLFPEGRTNPEDVGKLYVRSKDGRLVELSKIVKVQEAGGPGIINRVDRQRAITLFANLENKPLGQAKAELNSLSAKVLPPGYSGAYKGEAEIMEESFIYLVFALVLGIIIAYMVLASQFESFIHPFTILLSFST